MKLTTLTPPWEAAPGVEPTGTGPGGARCEVCILREIGQGGPIPAENSAAPLALVVGKAPGHMEVKYGRPYVGKAGVEGMAALSRAGIPRDAVSWDNAIACRLPGDNLEGLTATWQRVNKDRAKHGLPALPHPKDCCRPRVLTNIREHAARGCTNVLTFGKEGLTAVTGIQRPISDMRGAPLEGWLAGNGDFWQAQVAPGGYVSGAPPQAYLFGQPIALKILPTYEPAFVLRAKRWRVDLQADVAKAFRWWHRGLQWKEPKVYRNPDPVWLEWFLFHGRKSAMWTFDFETELNDPLYAKDRMVSIAPSPDEVVGIQFLSIDGITRFYDTLTERQIRNVLRRWFTDPSILKGGWNIGYFDRLIVEEQFGVTPTPIIDGILIQKHVASELPKTLSHAGSIYCDVRAWKSAHTAVEARSDGELFQYGCIDAAVEHITVTEAAKALNLREQSVRAQLQKHKPDLIAQGLPSQWQNVWNDHKLQNLCVGLHRVGLLVDQKRRQEKDVELAKKAQYHLKELRAAAGNPMFGDGRHRSALNPNSPHQLREIIFNRWGLLPNAFTMNNAPSVSDDSVRKYVIDQSLPEYQRVFFKHLRWFKKFAKQRGTFVLPLRRPGDAAEALDLSYNEEETPPEEIDAKDREGYLRALDAVVKGAVEKAKRAKYGGRCILHPDGRIHADWNAHSVVSGRLSSTNCNCQNFPRILRDLIIAPPGFVFVYIDADQLELRYSSALAKARKYLDVFEAKGDPHALSAEFLFGDVFLKANAEDRDRMRDFAKRFVYALIYGAQPETILDVLSSVENKKGELVYANVSIDEARARRRMWLDGVPEFEAWWNWQKEEKRKLGFLVERVGGRRRDFLDEDNENEWPNFVVQAGGAALINDATYRIIDQMPFEKWGPGTGLAQQGHDALMAVIPIEEADDTALMFGDAFNVHGREYGLDVQFTGKPKVLMPDEHGLSRWSAADDKNLARSPDPKKRKRKAVYA